MENKEKKYCNGYILAGGKSSRMGEDKGLILFNRKPVVQYVIDALAPVVDEVVIVSNNQAYEVFGLKVIADEIKDVGPAGGIGAALQNSTSEKNFIVGCDMPFVTREAIETVIKQSYGYQITLPLNADQLEPLFGVYTTDCKDEWLRLVREGIVKLHELVTHFNLKKLKTDNNGLFAEKLFMNINTRQELESALKQK
jgi:molybdopterin-guanine dinucleotide biosynthesis protein A